ncbi:hypothetical protein BDBG_16903 [Blastomyces gilchristii SLH14081]|uniref:Uncharacterized protein n=1 Tax=Blastomyces gilchristii (strain SLH14081) TaxID=559298 RepID=A0A179UKW5_BLAGS|nr:uncharacterized protein BDBG_16903 [Blastomyces gilchristii SLH14081]OAT07869.1 hypothetical protein BDBG_16903 [Blastomyces gilchristii SLH14081]
MPASHQPPYSILSASQSLQTVPASFISSQTLSHSLPSHSSLFSHSSQVPSFPSFKDHHEVQSRAENTCLNDFNEFFTGLDSLHVLIPSDAAVEHSSQYLQNERHGSHGFSDGDEDRGWEKDDESLPVPSPAVECGLVRSAGTKALPGDSSSTPVLDSTPHAGFLEPGCATSISHSPKADGGSNEAGTGIAGVHSIQLKRQRRPRAGTGDMHPMVAVEVPVIADRLEEAMSGSMRYENGLSSRLRTRQQKTRARSRREVPDTQDCKLPGKPVQCVEDNTTMSDMGSSSAHSDNTDDNYCASSEENGSMKPPSKHCRLSTPPSGPASRRPQFQIPRAAATAGCEDVEQENCRMVMRCSMTASDLAGETTAAANAERDYNEWKIEDLGGRRRH